MDKETIWAELRKSIGEVLPSLDGREVKPHERLVDLGANSVDRVEIVTLALEGLNLAVPLHELARADNIGGLVDLLHQKASACLKR